MYDDDRQLPSSAKPKRYFDVVPPGKTTPSPTSRPIISGNKAKQSDPMILDVDAPKVFATGSSDSDNDMAPEITAFGLNDDDLTDVSLAPDESAAPEFDGAEIDTTLSSDNSAINSETTESELETKFESNHEAYLNQSSSTSAGRPKTFSRLALPSGIDEDELLLPAHATPDFPNDIVVQEHATLKHRSKSLRLLQILVILVFFGIVVIDLLIDGGVISNSYNLPVTHLIN